jgi:hypothetical protein
VALQYMLTVLAGVLIYVSDNEDRWARFKQPMDSLLVEPRLRMMRGGGADRRDAADRMDHAAQARTGVSAPPNLRSIHPAPPNDIDFRGKKITLYGTRQSAAHGCRLAGGAHRRRKAHLLPELPPCHGDHLDGLGHYASGFNPIPANFQDTAPSPSSRKRSSSGVWRRAGRGCRGKGRRGIPPCRSWEDFLTERQIWQVVCSCTSRPAGSPAPRKWLRAMEVRK